MGNELKDFRHSFHQPNKLTCNALSRRCQVKQLVRFVRYFMGTFHLLKPVHNSARHLIDNLRALKTIRYAS